MSKDTDFDGLGTGGTDMDGSGTGVTDIGGLRTTDFKWICDPTTHSVRVYVCRGVLVVSPSPCRSDLLTTNQTVQI